MEKSSTERVVWSGKPEFTQNVLPGAWVLAFAGIFGVIGVLSAVLSMFFLGGLWSLMSLIWFIPIVVMVVVLRYVNNVMTGGNYPTEYKITASKVIYPAWRGWYEIGYPRNKRYIQPGPKGQYNEALRADIERVEVQQTFKDKTQGTGSVVIYLPSGLYQKSAGANRVVMLEHIKDFEKVEKLLKK